MIKKRLIITIAIISMFFFSVAFSACDSIGSSEQIWTIKEAYAEAKDEGFSGTYEEFLSSLANITDITKNSEGSLIFTLGDGTTIDVGNVLGEKGDNGNGITSLVKLSSNNGVDTYRITFTNNEVFDFIITNGKNGAPGIQGVKGEKGDIGKTGRIGFIVKSGAELAAAVNVDNAYIILAQNISDKGIVVNSGKNIIIDLNGYTYTVSGQTVGSSGTETNGFQLLKNSTVVIKNGIITDNNIAKILIQNYSNLTLDNVDVVGSTKATYVVSNNFGNVNFINNTSITATTGNVAFDAYGFEGYEEGVVVNLDASCIINGAFEISAGIEFEGNKPKVIINNVEFTDYGKYLITVSGIVKI